MKKLKTAILLILCMFASISFFACNKTIKLETISLSETEIVLRPGESDEILASLNPINPTDDYITFNLTDDSCVTLTVDEENPLRAIISAKDNVIGPVTTYIQAVNKDNSIFSNLCKITVYTEKTQLSTPQNLTYDFENQLITWDKIEAGSGYKLHVNIEGEEPEEVLCSTNAYKIDDYFNKVISVKVKCLGDDVVYSDSEYSEETFNFIQESEPQNLRNEGNIVKFNSVLNAKEYQLLVYEGEEKQTPDYVYTNLASVYNEEVGFDCVELKNLLKNPGITYIIKVKAIPNEENGVVGFASVSKQKINITKIATPVVNKQDFKFAYSTNTLSWKNLPQSSGYNIIRYKNGVLDKVYNEEVLTKDTNSLTLDVSTDKLTPAVYDFYLKVIGNNTEYLDSNLSASSIKIEKLATPTLRVKDGILTWNNISNSGGYALKIDNSKYTNFNNDILSYSMKGYAAKQYSFKIKAVGASNDSLAEYSITSEESEEFKAEKLATPEKPILQTDNKNIKFVATNNSKLFKINVIKGSTTEFTRNDLVLNELDNTNEVLLDVSDGAFDAGNYGVNFTIFADGYFTSEPSETYNFTKLANTNTFKIKDGVLSYSKPQTSHVTQVYIDGVLVYENSDAGFNKNNDYNFIPGVDYKLQLKHIPKSGENLVVSNVSEAFNIKRLQSPESLYVENGEIKFISSLATKIKIYVTKEGSTTTNIISNLSEFKPEDDVIYKLKLCHEGNNEYLNSDFSNEIKVKLLSEIKDLTLSGDNFSFNEIVGATSYKAFLKTNSNNSSKELTSCNFSLKDFILEVFPENYTNLTENVTFYVTAEGNTNYYEHDAEILVSYLNRNIYGKKEKSNEITCKILPSPTEMFVVKLIGDLEISFPTLEFEVEENTLYSNNNLSLNELYFSCPEGVNLFEMNYTNTQTNETISQILYAENLTVFKNNDGIITYKVNTEFLSSGNYNIIINAIATTSVSTDEENGKIIYNINAYEQIELNNITKIKEVNNLSCVDNKVIINDSDSNFAYFLTINGETIYDDVGAEFGVSSLNDIISLIQTDITKAPQILAAFKNKERIIPEKYLGTFNVNCYKMSLPTLTLDLLNLSCTISDVPYIKSDLTNSVTITRLESPNAYIKNGILQFKAIENATSYEIYYVNQNGNSEAEKITLTDNGEISFSYDIYNLLKDKPDNYIYYLQTITNKNNCLNSINSSYKNFTILKNPTLKVKGGEIVWDAVKDAVGYKLTIKDSGNKVIDEFETDNLTLSYNCMLTSKNMLINEGTYNFSIQALGVLGQLENSAVEEGYVMKSITNNFTATKLSVPNKMTIKDGKLVLYKSGNGNGVINYKLTINEENELIEFTTDEYIYELPERYLTGEYILKYQAIAGDENYLTSNISEEISAFKLQETNDVFVTKGELAWNEVIVDNYDNNSGAEVIYNLSVEAGNVIKQLNTTSTLYVMSEDNTVSYGLYDIAVKVIGDSNYYLNSNRKVLNNVVKLSNVTNISISEGKLVYANPVIITGTENNTPSIPNYLKFVFSKNGVTTTKNVTNYNGYYDLNEEFESGDYSLSVTNIGNELKEGTHNYSFINSELVTYSKTDNGVTTNKFTKLNNLTDLNISDGINLSWSNNNLTHTNKYLLNITHNKNDVATNYHGVVYSEYNYVQFDKIRYYINSNNEKILTLYENKAEIEEMGYELRDLDYSGSFDVFVIAYGDDKFINSDKSNTITITLPDPVTGLKLTHGKITWDESLTANGYILTLTRTSLINDIETTDVEFNKQNERIYLSGVTSFNLPDVGYTYGISIRAYALAGEGEQTMASAPTKYVGENCYFNSFNSGNGTDSSPYGISTEEQLSLIKYNNFATYILDGDIVLENLFTTLFNEEYKFIGKLLGNNKTIKNLKIESYSKYSGMFGYIDNGNISYYKAIRDDATGNYIRHEISNNYNGLIENLNLENVTITSGVYVGALAGFNNGTIKNINITSGNIISNSTIYSDTGASKFSVYSGSIAGINNGVIENVTNGAEIKPSATTTCYSGGITASNIGQIKNVKNNAKVYGTISGGIVAVNENEIEFALNTGDIVCCNTLENVARAGGIAGENRTGASIKNCVVDNNNITNTSEQSTNIKATYIGGLVGSNEGKCFNNFIKTILVNSNNASCFAGKILGYNSQETSECLYNYFNGETTTVAKNLCGEGSLNETNKEVEVNGDLLELLNNNKGNNNINFIIENNRIRFIVNN